MALDNYRTLVDALVRDDAGAIAAAERDQAIGLAVARYSTDRPLPAIASVVAAGGVLLDLPSGWQAGFSRLAGVEIPSGDDPERATPVDAILDQGLAGWRIRLDRALAAGQAAHVRFTIQHVLDAAIPGADSIPVKDRQAVACWAAALLLEQLASLYSGHLKPTIDADSVDWQSKGRDYAARAKRLCEKYLNHVEPGRAVAAGIIVDLGRTDGPGRLTHRRARRG